MFILSSLSGLFWQNINSQRKYPFADDATLLSTGSKGSTLPNDVIVDCSVWSPNSTDIYLGSINCKDGYVGVTFLENSNVVLKFSGHVREYEVQPLDSVVAGYSGFISFGRGVHKEGSWKFSVYNASKLLPSCVISIPGLEAIILEDARTEQQLSSQVRLINNTPEDLNIEIKRENDIDPVIVDGNAVNAVIFSLNTSASGVDVFQKYLHPAAVSPDNDNCQSRVIRSINKVVPDCDGYITINLLDLNPDRTGPKIIPYSLSNTANNDSILFGTSTNIGLDKTCDGIIKRYNESYQGTNNINEDCLDPDEIGFGEDSRCIETNITDDCGDPLDTL